MTRLVVLALAPDTDVSAGYDVRLGPLAFVCLADALGETLGDSLETVGIGVTPGDRKARALKLKLPIRAAKSAEDSRAAGYRLRREVRQLLENRRWRAQPQYFHWEADPELDGWVLFGGGELTETDPGVSFGEWDLELTDVYVVGRPGTHRLARRLELADRRTGLVPLDTRGLIYSTDHASQALPAAPLVIPGDVTSVLMTRKRAPTTTTLGPLRGARRLFRAVSAADGDVASFIPDASTLPTPDRQYLDLEDVGSVRVWDTSSSSVALDGSGWTTERDTTPELMDWERVLGRLGNPAAPLALDNGLCRLIWLGPSAAEGLAIESWDDTAGHYVRQGRLLGATNVTEVIVIETTSERAVIEWRGGELAFRAVLQRGWYGPRLEAYNDAAAGVARLDFAVDTGVPSRTPDGAVSWVDAINVGASPRLLWARGASSSENAPGAVSYLNPNGVGYTRTTAIVAQLGTPLGPTVAELAALAVADARPIPTLVAR